MSRKRKAERRANWLAATAAKSKEAQRAAREKAHSMSPVNQSIIADNIRRCQVFAALPPEQKPEKTQPIARDFAPLPLRTPLTLRLSRVA